MKRIDVPAIATILGIIATVVALGWWKAIGWTTPAAHEADIRHIEQDHSKTEQAIIEFQTRWMCDEWQEELDELIEKPTRTPLELEKVIQLRDALDETDCHKFN